MFKSTSRLSAAPSLHFQPGDRCSQRDQPQHPIKYDDYLSFTGPPSLLNSSVDFVNLSENNPLLNQEHRMPRPYHPSPSPQGRSYTSTSSSFKPANYNHESSHTENGTKSQTVTGGSVKVEPQLCEIINPVNGHDMDGSEYTSTSSWARSHMTMGGLPADLSRDDADS